MRLDRRRDRRLRGDGPAAQIVTKGKTAWQADHVHAMRQAVVLVPDPRHIKTGFRKGIRQITVTVRSGEGDDGGFHGRSLVKDLARQLPQARS